MAAAGLGGAVSIATAGMHAWAERRKAAREDARRTVDRAWEIQRLNIDRRREVYGELLRAGARFDSRLDYLAGMYEALADDSIDQMVIELREHGETFSSAGDEVVVVAVGGVVIDVAARFTNHVTLIISGIESEDWRAMPAYAAELHDLRRELIAACRRDLGLEPGHDGSLPW